MQQVLEALDTYMNWYVEKYEIKSEDDIRSEPHIPLYRAWKDYNKTNTTEPTNE